MAALEFDNVSEKIWEYYEKKHGYTQENYTLSIITGVNGPIVRNIIQLDNKRDLFVLFERKINVGNISL